tara:strand:- start:156 stop:458 length:303 start_codon:yes stop_codon:yes gene_type:complete
MSKRKYYPNKWKQVNAIPSKYFDSIEFEDLMDFKIGGYELPEDVVCLLRERNLKTNKVSEYTYLQMSAARRRTHKIIKQGDSELTICTHSQVAHIEAPNS